MPKKAKELSAIEVKRLTAAGFHAVGGVAGLYLDVNESAGRSWILRTTIAGRRRDVGLGGYPDVPLADAREKARQMKAAISGGADPIAERRAARAATIAEHKAAMTFERAVDDYLSSGKLDGFSNEKHRAQWSSTLRNYAVPVLGGKRLVDISPKDVKAVLDPIWIDKHETASRLRGRIEAVLEWAKVAGHRTGENPAAWKGNLSELLPRVKARDVQENHPAVELDEVAAWFAALRKRDGIAARALEFLVLTATRSGEIRGATWSEIDLDQKLWAIPAVRMKAKREHRVPLTEAAAKLLDGAVRFPNCDLVFPGTKGQTMSDMTLSAVMRRMQSDEISAGRKGWIDRKLGRPAVPHGLRSTFRDWVAERTSYPSELAEIALAHKAGNAVELAYRRGDMVEKRRQMMADWAAFLVADAT